MKKKWEIRNKDKDVINKIVENIDISPILATILVNRNITDYNNIKTFFNPTRNDFYDPFLLEDMDIAIKRILKAIKKKEKIIIYGDYDADGITSITVLKKFLEERGLKIDYYIPNRLDEGYGLNKEALSKIINQHYDLLITVDCGISGIEEIEYLKNNKLDCIVTDHHETLDVLPKALAVINPKRKDSRYPFRGLAGVGVVFKLIQAISITLKLDQKEYLKYLDIVSIGTISDIVPLIDENRVITKLGLKLIEQTKNVGLQSLVKACNFSEIDVNTISFGVAPRINACGRMGAQEEAIKLFFSDNEEEVEKITEILNVYNKERQERERKILEEAIKIIESDPNFENENAIILGNENWHHGVIGIVASKLTETFFKPTILICFEEELGKGSGRSIPGFDLYNALLKTSEYLEKFGGHSMAVGLSVKKSKFKNFKEAFQKLIKEENIQDIVPEIAIDKEIMMKDLNFQLLNQIKTLEPFGEGNRIPIFIIKNLSIDSIRTLSQGKHIKLTLREGQNIIDCIGFNIGYIAEDYRLGDKVDIVGTLSENIYMDQKKIQIIMQDMRKSY